MWLFKFNILSMFCQEPCSSISTSWCFQLKLLGFKSPLANFQIIGKKIFFKVLSSLSSYWCLHFIKSRFIARSFKLFWVALFDLLLSNFNSCFWCSLMVPGSRNPMRGEEFNFAVVELPVEVVIMIYDPYHSYSYGSKT